jgi:hypothetical protein
MAGYDGISKINGVAIGNVAKASGVLKANVWSVGGEQRQASLFRALQNSNWASYTAGKNSASFVAVGSSSSRAQVYFQYDNHSSGDTYNFSFTKTGTQGGRIMELRISQNADLLNTSGGGAVDLGTISGSTTQSISASTTNSTIYIGFLKSNTASTETLDIQNLIVTKS